MLSLAFNIMSLKALIEIYFVLLPLLTRVLLGDIWYTIFFGLLPWGKRVSGCCSTMEAALWFLSIELSICMS